MNFDNGHRQRQGQHNKRGRNRNNRRPGGGGGQNYNGGNSINRVYESNGPDVKVRGTAQTVAEKYMQLGRDAHSSGDSVMAESYYQFAEHYFRVLAAAQPVGQPMQQMRRPEEDEFDEDGNEIQAEGEVEAAPAMIAETAAPQGEDAAEAPQPNDQRNQRPREGRERFRPRFQNRRDVQDQPRAENGAPEPRAAEGDGPWEAPSFLTRPAPAVSEQPEGEQQRRPRRRPREEESVESGEPAGE